MKESLFHLLFGFCMGIADVVPGVSGGTVAFVLGIYERLVTAISRCDRAFVGLLLKGRLLDAARHIDLGFLCALGTGIVFGLATMLMAVNFLLSNDTLRPFTLAAFTGMILGSAVVVIRGIKLKEGQSLMRHLMVGFVGVAIAACVALLTQPAGIADPPMYYLFLCGAVAICAMILPGISGAMVLLLLGVYVHLTDLAHQLKAGEDLVHNFLQIVVFGFGCLTGLLCFSKLLRWLLANKHSLTLSMLCGLMLGSIPKIWPFQRNITPEITEFRKAQFALAWPEFNLMLVGVLITVIIAAGLVLLLEKLGTKPAPLTSGVAME
jgi:putative membrane protein